jgi:Pseudouridine synthase II TruB, C-terminal
MFNTAENSKILSLRLLSNEALHALLCCCFFLDKGQQLHKLPFLYRALACCYLRAGGDPVQKDAFTGLELPISKLVEGQWVCLHSLDNQFLGVGQILDNECVRPRRMLSTDTLTLS